MAPLPHFDEAKLQFICEICNLTKVFNEIEPEECKLICKSCWTQIQRENKIKSILNEDETS